MTVIVTGGRAYKNRELVTKVLDSLNITMLVQGGASGADKIAKEWANTKGIRCLTIEADWNKYKKAAGPLRNSEMLKAFPNAVVVAFKGGKGTEDCVQRAMSRGMLVFRVEELE